MNVVHIGESDSGGAGHAMSRLHHALRRAGVSSNLLLRRTRAPQNTVAVVATRGDADPLFPTVRTAISRYYVECNRTARSNTHFSIDIDGADVSREPLVADADVVHLHWTSSFQTAADVRRLAEVKPVVWTLHDLNPLTGGCHFPAGCEAFAGACLDCPQLIADPFRVTATALRDKSELWRSSGLTFIAPSRYMANLAGRSAVARDAGASIVHIPYGVDVDAFRVRSMAAARHALKLPLEARIVLCGADQNLEKRKGMRFIEGVLAGASAACKDEISEITLLTVGEPKLEIRRSDGGPVIQLGRISAPAMSSVYAAADIFVHPALEDNMPGMVLESLSSGTPVIAFDVGGSVEMIEDGISGRLVRAGDETAMARALADMLRDREGLQRMGECARARVETGFSDVVAARRHADFYASIAENKRLLEPGGSRTKTGIDSIFPLLSTACLAQEIRQTEERVAELGRVVTAQSEHIATLERDVSNLTAIAHESGCEVRRKDAALMALHEVAAERETLAKTLAAALSDIDTTVDAQRQEIELIHRVAADRQALVLGLQRAAEELQCVAQERLELIESLSHQIGQPQKRRPLWQRILRRFRALGRSGRAAADLFQQ